MYLHHILRKAVFQHYRGYGIGKLFPGDKDPDSHFPPTSLVCLPSFCYSVVITPLTFFSVISTKFLLHLALHTVLLSPNKKGKVSRSCLSFASRIENQPSLWAQRLIIAGFYVPKGPFPIV